MYTKETSLKMKTLKLHSLMNLGALAYGLIKGHIQEQADADQAYTQALMGDTIPGVDAKGQPCSVKVSTWVRLPFECRPDS